MTVCRVIDENVFKFALQYPEEGKLDEDAPTCWQIVRVATKGPCRWVMTPTMLRRYFQKMEPFWAGRTETRLLCIACRDAWMSMDRAIWIVPEPPVPPGSYSYRDKHVVGAVCEACNIGNCDEHELVSTDGSLMDALRVDGIAAFYGFTMSPPRQAAQRNACGEMGAGGEMG